MQTFQEIADSRGIELAVMNTATSTVLVDRDAIHQVFGNLIDNAMKYGEGGRKILIGACETEDGVQFYVRDFGAGIPSEHLPRLFERFYRVDKARSRESGGTGLGLAIAKHVVRAHGGTIKAESELNHGSTFYFTLPREEVAVRREARACNSYNACEFSYFDGLIGIHGRLFPGNCADAGDWPIRRMESSEYASHEVGEPMSSAESLPIRAPKR